MLRDANIFSGFSVNDLAAAKHFYSDVLGLEVTEDEMGLQLAIGGAQRVFIYDKQDHAPASFTILNFSVTDIDRAVDGLIEKGVKFEHYDNLPASPDEKGILRGRTAGYGPDIAWFKDPAGNILSLLQAA